MGEVVGGSEFSHPFITAFELRRDEVAGSFRGNTYFESPLSLIPSFLYPDKKPSMPEWFAEGIKNEQKKQNRTA